MNSREAFEAWYRKEIDSKADLFRHPATGLYASQQQRKFFQSWQAALAAQAQQPAKITADGLWNNEKLMSLNAELGLSMDALVKIAHAMQLQAQQTESQAARLQAAIEGECNGLAVDLQTAQRILSYVLLPPSPEGVTK